MHNADEYLNVRHSPERKVVDGGRYDVNQALCEALGFELIDLILGKFCDSVVGRIDSCRFQAWCPWSAWHRDRRCNYRRIVVIHCNLGEIVIRLRCSK